MNERHRGAMENHKTNHHTPSKSHLDRLAVVVALIIIIFLFIFSRIIFRRSAFIRHMSGERATSESAMHEKELHPYINETGMRKLR